MSNVRLGSMQWQLGLDQGNFQQGLAAAEGQVRQFGEKTTGSFSAMGVAMGNLISQGITKLAGAFQGLAGSAIQATANYQQMEVGLESLLAREIARGTEATRTTQVMVAGKEAELDKIAALQIAYDDYAIKLDKAKYHLAEISKTQGPGDIDFRAYANDVADYNLKLEQTKAKMDALRGTSDHMVTVTEKYMVGQMKISDAMPEAQKRAKGLMDELAKIAILSPYQVENVQQTYKMAMAFGYTSEQAKDFTQAILNVAAGTGASNDMLDRMAYNFAQVRMQGKVTAMDIRQLAMAGFDLTSVLKSVGDQFGVNIENHEDFNAAIANGSITWEQFTQGFKKYADDNFGGASERMAKTLNGLKSTFKDVFVLTFPKLLGPAAEHVTGFLQKMLDGFLKIRESGVLDELGQKIGDFVGGVVGNLEALMTLPKVIQDLASADPRNLAELKDILSQLPAGLRGVAEAGAELLDAFQTGGLRGVFEEAKGMVSEWAGDLWNSIGTWWEREGDNWLDLTIHNLFENLKQLPYQIKQKSGELREKAKDWLADIWSNLTGWWGDKEDSWVSEAVGKIWGAVKSIPKALGLSIKAIADEAVLWLAMIWEALGKWWDTGGSEWATDTAGKIGDWLAAIPDKLLELGMSAGDWLADVWTSMKDWWDTGGEEWAKGIAGKVGGAIQTLAGLLKSETVPEWINAAIYWLEPLWLGMADWWTASAKPLTDAMITGFDKWMNDEFVPALKATDKATWANGIGEALQMGMNQAIGYLYTPEVANDIAYAIANFFARSFFNAVSLLPSLVIGVLQAIFNAVFNRDEPIDLTPALEIIKEAITGVAQGLIDGFKQSPIGQLIAGVFDTWVRAIKDILGVASPSTVFFAIAQDLVQGLINGFSQKATDAKNTVIKLANDSIKGAVDWATYLIDTGKRLVAGLRQGISDAAQGFKEWIVDWARSIIPEPLWAFFGIASPSLLMMELGKQIVAGLIAGIKGMKPEAVTAMSEMIQALFGAISTALGAMAGIGSFTAVSDLGEKIGAFIDQIKVIVVKFVQLAGYFAGPQGIGLTEAQNVLEPLSNIFSALQTIMQPLTELANVTLPANATAIIASITLLLTESVPQIIAAIAEAARGISRQTMTDAALMAEVMGMVAESLLPVIEAIEATGLMSSVDVTGVFDWLALQITAMVEVMAEIASVMSVQSLKDAVAIAGQFALIVAPIEDMIGAVKALAEYEVRDVTAKASAVINSVFAIAGLLVNRFGTAGNLGVDLDKLKEAGKVAEAFTAIVKPWKDAIAAIAAIAEYRSAAIGLKATQIINQVIGLAQKMSSLTRVPGVQVLRQAAAAAALVVESLKPWQKAVDVVVAIVQHSGSVIGPKANQLVDQMIGLAYKLVARANLLGLDNLRQAAAVASLFLATLAPWQKAIEVVTAIAKHSGATIGPTANVLVDQMMGLAYKLVDRANRLGLDNLKDAATVAGLFLASLAPWQKAIEVVTAIAKHTAGKIGPAANIIVDQMMGLAEKLITRAKRIGLDRLIYAAKVAKLFEETLAPWEKAIKVADALRMWRIIPDLAERFDKLLEFVQQIVDDLIEAASRVDQDGLAAAVQFATAVNTLMAGLQAALELAMAMPAAWDVSPLVWEPFTQWVIDVFEFFSRWVQEHFVPDDPQLGLMVVFSGALESLMNALRTALDLALALPETWEINWMIWGSFVEWVVGVFGLFYAWATSTTTVNGQTVPLFTEDGLATTSALASALDTLMNALFTALELALALPATWTVDFVVWSSFVTWVQNIFMAFSTWVNENFPTPEDPEAPDQFGAITGFGNALGALMGGLSAALDLALSLPATWTVDPVVWNAFVTWVQGVFETFIEWVNENFPTPEDPEAPDQFGAITGFGGALEALMGGLSAALDLAMAFPVSQAWPAGAVWDTFFQWVTDVMDAFVTYVTEQLDPATGEGPAYDVVESFGGAMESVFGGLTAALALFQDLQGWVGPNSVLSQRLDAFLAEVLARMQQIAAFVAEHLSDNDILELTGDFGTALSDLVDGLGDALGFFGELADTDPAVYTLSQQFRDRVGNLILSIAGMLTAVQTYLVGPMQGAWNTAAQNFFDAADDVIGLLSDALDLFVELDEHGLPHPDTLAAFLAAVLNLFAQFTAGLVGPAGAGTLATVILGDLTALVAGLPAAMEPFVDDFFDIGHDLMEGVADGMGSMQWWLVQVVEDISDAMIAALRLALGIQSPSKVFKALGVLTGKGLAVGLLDSLPAIDRAMNQITLAMAPAWTIDPDVGFTKTIVVEFVGSGAAGAVPLPPRQFDALKHELIWELQRNG